MTSKASSTSPAIYRLSISRFRGIRDLVWRPARGVNVILGGGDAGKTTILDAVGLLLSPVNPANLADTDYHARKIEDGFEIEAVLSLPAGCGVNEQHKPSWPWEWDGREPVVPSTEDQTKQTGEPVYRVRVRGTEDLELVYEIFHPDSTATSFPVALRRSIGLVRLSGDDRNDRDLRLVQGSALDRLLSDKTLRSRMASALADNDVKDHLTGDAQTALKELDKAFRARSLPDSLDLAITGGQGASITALIGLTADRGGVQLPLASWGAGTRRLSALTISEQKQGEAPITLVDEVERGLEPYRQRALVGKLQGGRSQVFLTTHSPPALSAASQAALWFVDHAGAIGPLDAKKTSQHRRSDPETFLARLAIVAEGATEVGFASALLGRALGTPLEQQGLHVSDGVGHDTTIELIEELAAGGLQFGVFADDEGRHPTRWAKLSAKLGPLLFRWKTGCIEENVIGAVPDEKLEELITDPDGDKTGSRLRSLADRLDINDKSFAAIKAAAGAHLKSLIIEAALGKVPAGKESSKKEYKAHAQTWFKTRAGGRELFEKAIALSLWAALKPELMPFCNAVRTACGVEEREDIVP